VLFCTFLGTSVFAYMVGEITTLSARKHSSVDAFANKMDSVEEFMRFHNLPKVLRESVRSHYRKTWYARRAICTSNASSSLLPH
jgi:hypothetical protein